jgi:hypothetical protein
MNHTFHHSREVHYLFSPHAAPRLTSTTIPLDVFVNAKYWFRRVGTHPVYEALCRDAAEITDNSPSAANFLRTQSTWDPFAFVDLCASVLVGRAPGEDLCLRIQKREWELLFDWCYRQAVEEPPG